MLQSRLKDFQVHQVIASASNTTCREGRRQQNATKPCQASLGHTAQDRLPHSLADEIRAKLSDLSPVGAQSADRDSHRAVGAT